MTYKKMLIDALKNFCSKPENIDNFENYLDCHFEKWMEVYASNPENFIFELYSFSNMEV